MEYRKLGNSGALVSALALGTMNFGTPETPEDEAFAQLDTFIEAGGNLIDTADVYHRGVAEETVGRWLAARPREVTDRAVIATKGRTRTGDGPNDAGTSRRHLDRALATSLRRLGTDTVDLYQLHAWDPLTPVEETLSFLDSAIRAGKIRYAGLSNFTGWQLQLALSWVISRPGVVSAIVGARNARQLTGSLAAAGLHLDPDAMAALDAASDPHPAPYPYGAFGSAQRDRVTNGPEALGQLVRAHATAPARPSPA